jgi:uncharacterized tellurite resistance protein B-like protein
MSILEFFGFGEKKPSAETGSAETETVRRIVEKLDHMEPERARFIAAFAFVLSRVAGADMQVSVEETRAMERIVMEYGGLGEEQAILVVQMSKHQNLLFGGTENYLVTRELNRISSREQKKAILDCLFAVSAADDSITTTEGNVIRQISDQLLLEHSDFIESRSKYREFLEVLRKGEHEPGDGGS